MQIVCQRNKKARRFVLAMLMSMMLVVAFVGAACAPTLTPAPTLAPPTVVPATSVPPTATSAPPAELPAKWFLSRGERIPDGKAPTELKLTFDGETTTKAADGSTFAATGIGSFDPTSKKAAGGGKFTVKDSAGAVKSQGNWQVTDFVSWQQIAGGFPAALKVTSSPPPGTIVIAGILTIKVKLDNLGEATMEIHCKNPTTPNPAKLLEGVVITVGSTNFDTPVHVPPEVSIDPGFVFFYLPPGLVTP